MHATHGLVFCFWGACDVEHWQVWERRKSQKNVTGFKLKATAFLVEKPSSISGAELYMQWLKGKRKEGSSSVAAICFRPRQATGRAPSREQPSFP